MEDGRQKLEREESHGKKLKGGKLKNGSEAERQSGRKKGSARLKNLNRK